MIFCDFFFAGLGHDAGTFSWMAAQVKWLRWQSFGGFKR